MLQLLIVVGRALALALRGHRELVLENLALRQQLMAMKRDEQSPASRRVTGCFGLPCAHLANWRTALVLVRPETVVGWHRTGSAGDGPDAQHLDANGRPPITREIRALVREMATANPLWGAPRIHGELRTLGVDVSERTVSRLLKRAHTSAVADVADLPDESPRVSRVDGLLHGADAHGTGALRRRGAVAPSTAHPASQHDGASDRRVGRATGGRGLSGRHGTSLDPPGSRPHLRRGLPAPPGGHGHRRGRVRAGESVAESVRRTRDRLDPTGVSRSRDRRERAHLRRVLTIYLRYYHRSRTHLGLEKDTPDRRPVAETSVGPIIAMPEVGGLHHRYERRAA